MAIDPLPKDSLYRRCDPSSLTFNTTDELEELTELPGQTRALCSRRSRPSAGAATACASARRR
jgi:hypothetical protein